MSSSGAGLGTEEKAYRCVITPFVILVSTATRPSSQVTFPIDFFEHNQQLTDVEFGGNDLLQVYNAQQIKHRLNSTGMYVANTKVRPALGWIHFQGGGLKHCGTRIHLECKCEVYIHSNWSSVPIKWFVGKERTPFPLGWVSIVTVRITVQRAAGHC